MTNTPEEWKQRLYDSYLSNFKLFSADAGAETFLRTRGPYLRALIKRHVPPNREARIVDLGCGHGAILHFLRQAGYHSIFGIDVSAEQIDQAHRLGIMEATFGDVETFLNDSPPEEADVLIAFDVLEHLCRAEMFSVLTGIHRILAPGGKCIVHVPNAEGIYGMRIRYGDLTHEQAFTANSLRQAFISVGFSRVECFEDKPTVGGAWSLLRRIVWDLGTLWHRVLLIAESGSPRGLILSQNITAIAFK